MADTFWSDAKLEPKRAYRFLMEIAGTGNGFNKGIRNYVIKKVKKPSFEVSESKHSFLNHSFKFPGKVTWSDITVTAVDALEPDGAQALMALLNDAGYKKPTKDSATPGPSAQTISKKKFVEAVKRIVIRQIDSDGNIVEEWEPKNAWCKVAEFGDLDTDSDELMNIQMTFAYDYPEFRSFATALKTDGGAVFPLSGTP